MVDMGSITAAVGSLKVAGDIAMGLINLKTMAEVQAKAIELNQKIIAAQHEIFAANAAQSTLVERVRDLEKQIARMEAWEAQKKRYQMASVLAGTTIYALKKSMSDGEPPHYICASCYQTGHRSILQNGQDMKTMRTFLVCPNPACKAETPTGYNGFPQRRYAEDIKQPE